MYYIENIHMYWNFPCGANREELACQCRRPKRCEFNSWVKKIPWRRKGQPTPVFLPGELHGQRSLAGGSLWGRKDSDTTERLSTHMHVYLNQCLLLSREDAGEPDSWSSLSYEIPYGDCSVRHHRELDVYMLTSESEPHQEPPLPGDSCTGHIFKLMNIQQQLMVRKKISIFSLWYPHPFPQ